MQRLERLARARRSGQRPVHEDVRPSSEVRVPQLAEAPWRYREGKDRKRVFGRTAVDVKDLDRGEEWESLEQNRVVVCTYA